MRTKLVAAREGKGLTQQQAAEILGVSRPYYSQIESGAREPSIGVLRRIADLFELTFEQVLEAENV